MVTTVKSGNSTECRSFHLTSFAVLLVSSFPLITTFSPLAVIAKYCEFISLGVSVYYFSRSIIVIYLIVQLEIMKNLS